MDYKQAKIIADELKEQFAPYCERIEVAGSIRREKPENIKDVELVVIPKRCLVYSKNQLSLFMDDPTMIIPIDGFKEVVNKFQKVKGSYDGKYTQRLLPQGVNLDLFMVKEDNWGIQFAMRTGSGIYSRQVLATTWCKCGYHSINGMLCKDETPIPIYEEEQLFDLIGLKWIPPKNRNL